MLKRRYGASSLSLERLKGIDGALYQILKDHFIMEVKSILLEQSADYVNQPFEVVALSRLELQESSTSDEEVKLDENEKHVPKKCMKVKRLYSDALEEKKGVIKNVW